MNQLKPLVTTSVNDQAWDNFVAATSGAFLQTSAWGHIKSKWGWAMRRVALQEGDTIIAGAQLLFRRLPLRRTIAYLPRGPLVSPDNPALITPLFEAIHHLCRRENAMLLTVEPEWTTQSKGHLELLAHGLRPSPYTVQPSATILLDLCPSEEAILAQMHQKWRYNIRLAGRREITVRRGRVEDLPIFHRLTAITGERDGFAVRPAAYYTDVYQHFGSAAHLFVAEYEGQALSAILVVHVGKTAVYLYGASSNAERQRMPNHAIQWAAISHAKASGCEVYDFWGIPGDVPDDGNVETLGEGGLWGVFRFKQGFGGQVTKYVGAYDYVYNPLGYFVYQQMRRRAHTD